jgi:ribosomal protein S18 acetylase RimI-like enzyme
LPHRRFAGFRIYPPFEADAEVASAPVVVRAAVDRDQEWVAGVLRDRWAGPVVVTRGRAHDATMLAALVAETAGERLGLATYRVEDGQAELITLDALVQGRGIGSALLQAVIDAAAAAGCRRLWLITTNDNLDAIRFYQRRGMRLVAVHRGAVDEARKVKPQIPQVGEHGIAVHDEIELDITLDGT